MLLRGLLLFFLLCSVRAMGWRVSKVRWCQARRLLF